MGRLAESGMGAGNAHIASGQIGTAMTVANNPSRASH
jgi:hypothetical protein